MNESNANIRTAFYYLNEMKAGRKTRRQCIYEMGAFANSQQILCMLKAYDDNYATVQNTQYNPLTLEEVRKAYFGF